MKRILIILYLLIAVHSAMAQKQGRDRIDSILQQLKTHLVDTTRIRMLNRVSLEIAGISVDSGLLFARQSLTLANKIGWKPGISGAYNALSIYYINICDYASAIKILNIALGINEEIHNTLGITVNTMNLGVAYANLKDNEKAVSNYSESLRLAKTLNRNDLVVMSLLNLGKAYLVEKRYDSSFYFLKQGVEFTGTHQNIEREHAYLLKNLGRLYLETNHYDLSDSALNQSLRLNTKLGLMSEVAGAYYMLGKLYNKKSEQAGKAKDFSHQHGYNETALNYLHLSLYYFSLPGSKIEQADAFHEIALTFSEFSRYDSAFLFLNKYLNAHDSIYSLDYQRKIAHIESEKEIAIKNNELIKEKAIFNRDRIYFVSGIITLLIFLFFIFRERRRADSLLLNILPPQIARRLKRKEKYISDKFEEVSIIFIDIAGFTKLSMSMPAENVVSMLNKIFTSFDEVSGKYGIEKIKTIGDCYMAVAGVPLPLTDHADRMAEMALELKRNIPLLLEELNFPLQFRIGIDCGPVVAGVIGSRKFIYDLWGDAVNTASRMESNGVVGEIHCTGRFKIKLEGKYFFESRGAMEIKGKGNLQTWLLKEKTA